VLLDARFWFGMRMVLSMRFRLRGSLLGLDLPHTRLDGLRHGPDLILVNGQRWLRGQGLTWRRRGNVLVDRDRWCSMALRFRADERRGLGEGRLDRNGIGDFCLHPLRQCVFGYGGQIVDSRLGGGSRLRVGCIRVGRICLPVVGVDIGICSGSRRLRHNRLGRHLVGTIDRKRLIAAEVVPWIDHGRRGGLRINGRLRGLRNILYANLDVCPGLSVAGGVGRDCFLGPRRYLRGYAGCQRCHDRDRIGNGLAPRGIRLGHGRPRLVRFGRLVATHGIVHLPFALSRLYRCDHGTAK
jgi:hypothetical protein